VIELLRARRARGSRVPHGDGASIALVVEGGAMRGVISAGMVWALEDLGLVDAFDAIYGSSAGAINAAYFLGGRAGIGTTIYYEDINSLKFIDPTRPLRGRPILDLGFLFDDVAAKHKPLPVAGVLASATPLTVVATDIDAAETSALRGFGNALDLVSALRASATMPIVAGGPRAIGGRRYFDASICEPLAVATAERDGHTHVLALLTRRGRMNPRASLLDRYYVAPRLRRLSPSLAQLYLTRSTSYNALLNSIDAGTGPLGRAQVRAVRPLTSRVHRLECRRGVLERGARDGYEAVINAFGADGAGALDERLR
jgi:predicted patatin/cPLA2 family phospholipase